MAQIRKVSINEGNYISLLTYLVHIFTVSPDTLHIGLYILWEASVQKS